MGVVIISTLLSTIALIIVFTEGWENSIIAILIYVFAFYALIILSIAVGKIIPSYYKSIKTMLYANPYANQYFTDKAFQSQVKLYASLVINLVYVVLNIISAVLYHTNWFGIFAVYYAIIAMMRFLLVRFARRNQIGENRIGEWKRSRACASILLTVNLVLSGVVLMMLYFDRRFEYQGFLIYVIALYTFYVTVAAIVDIVKGRKNRSPLISMSIIIRLAAALFSMLFLETAMFAQFGQKTSTETKKIMIMTTGAGISIVVVSMAWYMIVRSTKEIKEIRSKQ